MAFFQTLPLAVAPGPAREPEGLPALRLPGLLQVEEAFHWPQAPCDHDLQVGLRLPWPPGRGPAARRTRKDPGPGIARLSTE